MARILILGGDERGRLLAQTLLGEGHAVRVVYDGAGGQPDVELQALGAECFPGDPDRLGTLRGALDGVAVACWLYGSAHAERLDAFLTSAIDSTVRVFLYEAPSVVRARARATAARNAIPAHELTADTDDPGFWLATARATLSQYL